MGYVCQIVKSLALVGEPLCTAPTKYDILNAQPLPGDRRQAKSCFPEAEEAPHGAFCFRRGLRTGKTIEFRGFTSAIL